MARSAPVVALVLAGGLARRMGGVDKTLLPLDGGSLLDCLLDRIKPQCAAVAISANGDARRFGSIGCPVIPDAPGPSLGPLAGVLAGLDWLASTGSAAWLLTVPGDTPFVPLDLVPRLLAAAEIAQRPVARIRFAGRLHSLVALWSLDLREPLRDALHGRDLRKVTAFQAEVGVADLDWPPEPNDPFFNINTPEDLAMARRLAMALQQGR